MMKRVLIIMIVTIISLGLTTPTMAYAYDGFQAAVYSYNWACNGCRNPNYPPFYNDCTNFASQALHEGGGYPYRNYGYDNGDDRSWWVQWTNSWPPWAYTRSWPVAIDLATFLYYDYPGGWYKGLQCYGSGCHYDYHNDAQYGDILFYDWGAGENLSHSTVEGCYNCTDPNAPWFTGDVVNAHTSDRQLAMWTLWDYNEHRYTTSIYLYNIDPGN